MVSLGADSLGAREKTEHELGMAVCLEFVDQLYTSDLVCSGLGELGQISLPHRDQH